MNEVIADYLRTTRYCFSGSPGNIPNHFLELGVIIEVLSPTLLIYCLDIDL